MLSYKMRLFITLLFLVLGTGLSYSGPITGPPGENRFTDLFTEANTAFNVQMENPDIDAIILEAVAKIDLRLGVTAYVKALGVLNSEAALLVDRREIRPQRNTRTHISYTYRIKQLNRKNKKQILKGVYYPNIRDKLSYDRE